MEYFKLLVWIRPITIFILFLSIYSSFCFYLVFRIYFPPLKYSLNYYLCFFFSIFLFFFFTLTISITITTITSFYKYWYIRGLFFFLVFSYYLLYFSLFLELSIFNNLPKHQPMANVPGLTSKLHNAHVDASFFYFLFFVFCFLFSVVFCFCFCFLLTRTR